MSSSSDPTRGWQGTGHRGKFRNEWLPTALNRVLDDRHLSVEYAGSYKRHTTLCTSDIDIHIRCKQGDPVTRNERDRVVDELRNLLPKNSKVEVGQNAVSVSIPRMRRSGKRVHEVPGPDEYDVVFLDRRYGGRLDTNYFPSIRGGADRLESDRALNAFYKNNPGAQNVARLIKYQTYYMKNKVSDEIFAFLCMIWRRTDQKASYFNTNISQTDTRFISRTWCAACG